MNTKGDDFSGWGPESRDEIRRYDSAVTTLVAEARGRFLFNLGRGKKGWDRPGAWHDDDEPLHRAHDEIQEALDARGDDRLREEGDAMNFLVFAHALQRRRLSEQ